ncbi:hypothetical protein CHARACLAT_024722 [Characodon lateralis]|uniref:Uncharacterized protein n=1 Tax=Characodon lateralis TaxID=208331 RepID=A0ABU7D3X9_9TELE|nr:hypothetical protein [Characodon lateralis]
MAENCFWIKVKEEKFENPDLFAQLSLYFSSQSKVRWSSTHSHCNPTAQARNKPCCLESGMDSCQRDPLQKPYSGTIQSVQIFLYPVALPVIC